MLCSRPLCERRQLLECNVTEIKNRIMLAEQTLIKVNRVWEPSANEKVACLCLQSEEVLSQLMMSVIKQGLEGLVLKDTKVLPHPNWPLISSPPLYLTSRGCMSLANATGSR